LGEHPRHARGDHRCNTLDVRVVGRPREVEARLACTRVEGVHAVDRDGVDVRVTIQASAEALLEREHPRLGALDPFSPCTLQVEAVHDAHEDLQHRAKELRVRCEERAKGIRNAQHPLAYGRVGQHLAHHVQGGRGHAPSRA
jgi:hypothetical protein